MGNYIRYVFTYVPLHPVAWQLEVISSEHHCLKFPVQIQSPESRPEWSRKMALILNACQADDAGCGGFWGRERGRSGTAFEPATFTPSPPHTRCPPNFPSACHWRRLSGSTETETGTRIASLAAGNAGNPQYSIVRARHFAYWATWAQPRISLPPRETQSTLSTGCRRPATVLHIVDTAMRPTRITSLADCLFWILWFWATIRFFLVPKSQSLSNHSAASPPQLLPCVTGDFEINMRIT